MATLVTVPDAAAYSAPWAASASVSQDQPTSASSGSVIISRSTSARTKATQRNVPSHEALPAGSCSRIIRPVPTSSPSTVTSAVTAAAYGAIRWGAGIGSTCSSGRRCA